MWRTRALILTIIALAGWIVFCLSWHPPRIQEALRTESLEVLAVAGLSGVQLQVSGREVVLEGAVASPDLRGEAERLVRGVRGVRTVDTRLSLLPAPEPPAPLFLELLSRPEGLVLRGPVPSEEQRRTLHERAVDLVGVERVEDQLVVDPAAEDSDALASAAEILRIIARSGQEIRVRFRGNSIRLSGTLVSEEVRRRVDRQVTAATSDVRTVFSALQVARPEGESRRRPEQENPPAEPPAERAN